MVREIITIDVGGAGINLGSTIWEQYNLEHNIDNEGHRVKKNKDGGCSFRSFYEEISDGTFRPKSLIADTECNAINNIKTSQYKNLFDSNFMISSAVDISSDTFAEGHYGVGKDVIDKVNDRLRKMVGSCDNVQGFMVNHSMGGGAGSGLASLILSRLAVDYRKKTTIDFQIYSDGELQDAVQTYNTLLALHWSLDHTEISMVFDNRQLQNICRDRLLIEAPSYDDINSRIAKHASSMTGSLRFEGELNVDMNEFQTNLIPFPRVHALISAMAPIIASDRNKQGGVERRKLLINGYVRENHVSQRELLYEDIMNLIYSIYNINIDIGPDRLSIAELSEDTIDPKYFSIECLDFDIEQDKYMAISSYYRGDFKGVEVNSATWKLKTDRKLTFVEWCPTGFKVGIMEEIAPLLPRDATNEKLIEKQVFMMGNNVCISRFFNQRICKIYDKIYPQKVAIDRYIDAGMEEEELAEAREDIGFLEKDYFDILNEMSTDEEDEDEEDY